MKYDVRELVELSDGGVLALDWFIGPHKDALEGDIVAIVPGVTGDGTKLYIMEIVKAAWDNGYRPVIVNYRGQGGVPLQTARIYHGADTQDLTEAIQYLSEKYCKHCKIFTMGISLGAGILANYLCAAKGSTPVTASCSIACHFDTTKAV
jgi:predicted alpha/beta-fold hydrolase